MSTTTPPSPSPSPSSTQGGSTTVEFSDETLAGVRRREESLREFEIKNHAQQLRNVPTLDEEVRMAMRFYGEPMTLFGEGPGERRERLKLLMARMDLDGVLVRPQQFTVQYHHLLEQQIQQQQRRQAEKSVPMEMEEMGEEEEEEMEEGGKQKETFFTEGPELLKAARLFIAQYSLARASERVHQQQILYRLAVHKAESMIREDIAPEQQFSESNDSGGSGSGTNDGDDVDMMKMSGDNNAADQYNYVRDIERKNHFVDNLKKFSTSSTQLSGDNRPIQSIAVAKGVVLTASWSGIVKLWNLNDSAPLKTFRAHDDRATGCCFHPDVDMAPLMEETDSNDVDMTNANDGPLGGQLAFASGGADNVAKLWSLQDTRKPLQVLQGHTGRLAKMAFHPSGRFLGTASFDGTWRLWDVESGGQCLVTQEGHSSEVYSVVFQGDGSLCGSCDLGGIGRVWDLRTGRSIVTLKGHARKILGLDWHPNGYLMASSSDDNTIRIWDMRKMGECVHAIPAHNKLISHVKFEPVFGRYLVSASYDHTCKIWSTLEYRLVKTLRSHENLVFCADIYKPSGDSIANPYSMDVEDAAEKDSIVSCSYDRTWSTYSLDPLALEDL